MRHLNQIDCSLHDVGGMVSAYTALAADTGDKSGGDVQVLVYHDRATSAVEVHTYRVIVRLGILEAIDHSFVIAAADIANSFRPVLHASVYII